MDAIALLGFVGFFCGWGLAYHLTQVSPTAPNELTAQIVPYDSHGVTYYVRRLEVLGLNVGLVGCMSVSFVAIPFRVVIFGGETESITWFSAAAHIVIGAIGVIALAMFLVGGGNWPISGFSP